MSRTTMAIKRITEDLDSISGLTGIVDDFMEIMQKDIHEKVEFIKANFPEASLFDYYGIPKSK